MDYPPAAYIGLRDRIEAAAAAADSAARDLRLLADRDIARSDAAAINQAIGYLLAAAAASAKAAYAIGRTTPSTWDRNK